MTFRTRGSQTVITGHLYLALVKGGDSFVISRSPPNFQAIAGFWCVLLTRVGGLGNPAFEGPGFAALPRTSNPGGGMYRGLRPLILGDYPGCMGGVWQPPAVSF